jgi:hypothetical protein
MRLVASTRTLRPWLGVGAAAVALAFVGSASATTFSISGSMEGDLRVNPGTTIFGGFDFTMPGSHPAATVSFVGLQVSIPYRCGSGPILGSLVFAVNQSAITIPANNNDWYPSGDQKSPLVLQAQATVPDVCNGGEVRMDQGATFSGDIRSTDTSDVVHIRFHYGPGSSSKSWSGTLSVIPDPTPPTAVGVTSLAAARNGNAVTVTWRWPSADILGFSVYRQDGAQRVRLNRHLIRSSGLVGSYRFVDAHAPATATLYWVRAVRLDGRSVWVGRVAAARATA